MKEFIKNNIKLLSVIGIVIIIGAIGITYAYSSKKINLNITTGEYNVVYTGTSTIPLSNLRPITDNEITTNTENVLKIDFTVKGAQTNPTDKPIIYDVSLTDLDLPEELRSRYFKWRLYKNNRVISEGNFKDGYDPKNNNRMVLTYAQQDLKDYSDTGDSYVFYAWLSISEDCFNNITYCNEGEITNSSLFVNKNFSGNIRIELSTGEKKAIPVGKAGETIVNLGLENSLNTDEPTFSKTSCSDGCEESKVGIYRSTDDFGPTYYFRGDVENNYVKFGKNTSGADMYWRIIRINGDGTIRMIYDGTSAYENGELNTDGYVTNISYSYSSTGDNTYVGYMTGTVGATTYEETHSNTTDSKIKDYLENNWYKNTIKQTEYEQYIVDAIFCNDRTLNTRNSSYTGIGKTTTQYGSQMRYITGSDASPKLTCAKTNDRFTYNPQIEDIYGNDKLNAPVGLITTDEVIMAGASGKSSPSVNESFYLHKGFSYHTMTPKMFNGTYAYIQIMQNTGKINHTITSTSSIYVRPVISLKADALKYGTGLKEDPFRITEEI